MMATVSQSFKRLVLGLSPNRADQTAHTAVELANRFRLDVLGVFFEDPNLAALPDIPFAREFRALGGGWNAIDPDRLARELDLAARAAERAFTQAARRLLTKAQFEVQKAYGGEVLASLSRAGDIILVGVPQSAVDPAARQSSLLLDAAYRMSASVMLVPRKILRTTGPVAAIAARPDDPSLSAAAAFALATRQDLVVFEIDPHSDYEQRVRALASETGLTIRRFSLAKALLSNAGVLSRKLIRADEALIVAAADAIEKAVASSIATSEGVPVLLVETRD